MVFTGHIGLSSWQIFVLEKYGWVTVIPAIIYMSIDYFLVSWFNLHSFPLNSLQELSRF